MKASLNKIMLIGNLGKDPETKTTSNGKTITKFTLATNERFKDASGKWTSKAEWHTITAFGKTAEVAGQYLRKGSAVYIEGRISNRTWQDTEGKTRYGTDIVAQGIQFLDSGRRLPTTGNAFGESQAGQAADPFSVAPDSPITKSGGGEDQPDPSELKPKDDDLPF